MPELPEVETTRRGIEPHLLKHRIKDVVVRHRQLRWPVPARLRQKLTGQKIQSVTRRGKYLLLDTGNGTVILHLGMSGSLRVLPCDTPAEKHDHVDFVLDNRHCLRLRDPRRFGAVLWTEDDPLQHKLLKDLGPEPLAAEFNGDTLWQKARGRKLAIKLLIMDSKIVVGVGNIYANEALFMAGIKPTRPAGKLSRQQAVALVKAIKQVLRAAIRQGGTTLRDFTATDGQPGYFRLKLKVYDKAGEPCPTCGAPIKHKVIGQRSSYYCSHCQQ